MTTTRRLRADGRAARRRILDATAELAGEYGFDGTTIALVSDRSGQPKSSIYWHFAGKEELIEAVVVDSYERWIEGIKEATSPDDHERLGTGFTTSIRVITRSPDFLRLGLMLCLERREVATRARTRFLSIRAEVIARLAAIYTRTFPDLPQGAIDQLAHLTLALTDGFFIADQSEELDLHQSSAIIERAIVATAHSLLAAQH